MSPQLHLDSESAKNAATFAKEMEWFDRVMLWREYQWKKAVYRKHALPGNKEQWDTEFELRFKDVKEFPSFHSILSPDTSNDDSLYAGFINHYGFGAVERIAIFLALLPHIAPGLLVQYSVNFNLPDFSCPELGIRKTEKGLFIPTWETLFFIIAGTSLVDRSALFTLLDPEHVFYRHRIMKRGDSCDGLPETANLILLENDVTDRFTLGYVREIEFSNDFPAKKINTEMEWGDLVLASVTKRQVEEVRIWLRQRDRLMNEFGMKKRLKPGNKVLFYGPPGTGKTLTASLLGKFIEKDVYRIDLSMIVSKYIGETEKNLAKVFDKAQYADWILFFDEADALFGSRTKVSSSHDRYANQEVSYLLQRIEDYSGIVILASNMKGNIDDAFMRRFNAVVHFPFPKAEERNLLWKNAFSEKIRLTNENDLKKVADKYELSGGSIVNAAAWCQLMAIENENYTVSESLLRESVARELAKEGRTL